MSSKEILVQNESDSNLCVNDILLKKGESLILSNVEDFHIYIWMKISFVMNYLIFMMFFLEEYYIFFYESKILKQ